MTKSRAIKPKQKPARKNPRKTKSTGKRVDAAYALRYPFESTGFKWPDQATSMSSTATSKYRFTLTPSKESGTSTSFSAGMILTPSPDAGYFVLNGVAGGSPNIQDVTFAGTAWYGQGPVPNLASLRASPGLARCTGIGARVTYGGTELQRSGRIVAGIGKHIYTPAVTAATGTRLSCMSTMTNGRNYSLSPTDFIENLTNVTTGRVEDGVFDAHWRPSKVPTYMALNNANLGMTTAAGVSPSDNTSTPLNQVPGLQGVEAGQSSLCIVIEGDTTAAAAASGNPYFIDVIWHWEYIPMDPLKTIVEITPSPYDPLRLAAIINSIELGSTAQYASTTSNSSYQPESSFNASAVWGAAKSAITAGRQVYNFAQEMGYLRGNTPRRQFQLMN